MGKVVQLFGHQPLELEPGESEEPGESALAGLELAGEWIRLGLERETTGISLYGRWQSQESHLGIALGGVVDQDGI